MKAKLQAVISFATTRRLARPGLPRTRFDLLQKKAIAKWMRTALPQVAAFADHHARLEDLPVMDKARLMTSFAAYNRAGVTAEAVRAALRGDCRIGDLTVGASTGTSGHRGYFVISEAERFRWLGTILAKTMADLLWRPQRVAILLPQGTGLYDSANHVWRLSLRFFNLTEGPATWRAALERFDPTVIVAPPKVLRHMAEHGFALRPARVFSAAETLDPVDRPVIEAAFGGPLRQIYMATEGLLGVTCHAGRMHLAEDSVHFSFEPAGGGLVTPLISSFRRETQILARYRMNDLLSLDDTPCPCGSPLQVAHEIVGRMDDCFFLQGQNSPQMITPDVLRNALLGEDPRITDFRIIQTGGRDVEVVVSPGLPTDAVTAIRTRLDAVFARRAVTVNLTVTHAPMPLDVSRKLRRVECRYVPDAPA